MKGKVAAIFDVDGTLFENPSTERRFIKFLLERDRFPPKALANFIWGGIILLPKGLSAVLKGNKYYLRGWPVKETRELLKEFFQTVMVGELQNQIAERLQWHQQEGHLVFLLSGMPLFILEQFCEHFGIEHVYGSKVIEKEGKFLGALENQHPYGKKKAEALRRFAGKRGIDLQSSYGYGDHYTDRHFLKLVGYPVVVNPKGRLKRLAERRGWEVAYHRTSRVDSMKG